MEKRTDFDGNIKAFKNNVCLRVKRHVTILKWTVISIKAANILIT